MAAREIKAGEAAVELGLKNKTDAGLKAAEKKFRRFGSKLQNIGRTLTVVGATITAAFAGAVGSFASVGDKFDKMSARLGIGVETLSALSFAANQTGTDIDQLSQAMFRASRRIGNAITETGPAKRALDELGLSASELASLTPEDQFFRLVDALNAVTNEARRSQLGFEIFGDNWRQIKPLIDSGTDGIRAYMAEAKRLGIVLTTEQSKAAAEFTDALARVKFQLKFLAIGIGSQLAPALTDLLGFLKPIIAGITTWMKQNPGLVKGLAIAGVVLLTLGTALVVIGGAITLIAVAIKGLAIAFGILANPITLIIALFAAATVAFFKFYEPARKLIGKLFAFFKKVFGGIIDALMAGELALAGKIALTALHLAWRKGITALMEVWLGLKQFVVNIWHGMIDEARTAWANFLDLVGADETAASIKTNIAKAKRERGALDSPALRRARKAEADVAKKLDELIGEAKKAREEAKKRNAASFGGAGDSADAGGRGTSTSKATALGTFDPAAVLRMAGAGVPGFDFRKMEAKKTRKAAEATARHTKKMADRLDAAGRRGLVFA